MNRLILLFVMMMPSIVLCQAVRVGGNYKIEAIRKNSTDQVVVIFEAVQKTGKYDKLKLTSDHVHMNIKVGSQLRISAELVEAKPNGLSLVSQVQVFLPTSQGSTPVWMLSKTHPPKRVLGGSKMIEMHAPGADYLIF